MFSIASLILSVILVLSVIHAAPQFDVDNTTPIPIISQTESTGPDGSFNYSFETANGIRQETTGFTKTILVPLLRSDGTATGEEEPRVIIAQTGTYSYTAPDGTLITLSFIADENGFQPMGEHLPTSVPIPAQIINSLQQNQPDQLPQVSDRKRSINVNRLHRLSMPEAFHPIITQG